MAVRGAFGARLAAELEAVDPFTLDEDDLARYLRAARRLEAWADSLLTRGIHAFVEAHALPDTDEDACDGEMARSAATGTAARVLSVVVRGAAAFRLRCRGRRRRCGSVGRARRWSTNSAADALAPLLQVAPLTAGHLIGDALDLRTRLPWVCTGLREGSVSWSAARAIAAGTRELSQDLLDKARVDERLCRSATRLTPGRLRAGYGWMPLWSLTESHVRVVRSSSTDLAHPNHGDPDPGYAPRRTTRHAIAGRDHTCRFPGCHRRARAWQVDHTRPWPHGPTCACNLGSLCTRHHRPKTHTGWHLRQPWPGVFLWRDPAGRYWLVDHTGTTRLDADAA
jgi:hypothetical protein